MFDAVRTEYGAATIVSGIGSFRGVTIGTDMKSTAHVRLTEGGRTSVLLKSGEKDTSLVRQCIEIVRHLNSTGMKGLDVEVESEIPASRGMKSSSSVSLAVIGALLDAFGVRLADRQLLRYSAKASMLAGVSVTGAFDDAAACHLGGLIFADNRRMVIERRRRVSSRYSTVFFVPERKIRKSGLPLAELRKRRKDMLSLYGIAKRSMFREAAASNTLLLCRLLGIDPAPMFSALLSGASIAGLSGTGPAFFAVAEKDCMRSVESALRQHGRTAVCGLRGVSENGIAF